MNVVYAPRALRDIKSIGAYLLERNPGGAVNVLGAIRSSIDALSFFPQIGRLVDNAGHRRYLLCAILISSSIALRTTRY